MAKTSTKEPILCYIDGPWAYFTTQNLHKQWGDDWDDRPYECNAGSPYGPCWHNDPGPRNDPDAHRGWKPGTETPLDSGELCRCDLCRRDWNKDGTPKWEIIKVAWDGDFCAPCDWIQSPNNNWSVKDINSKCVPWLQRAAWKKEPEVKIWAGTKLSEFKKLIRKGGGAVYVEEL